MTKFIIIDHSIKGQGGHFLEYANRVLDAAQVRGFETLVVAHRDFAGRENLSRHPVRPWFHRAYWDNHDHWGRFLQRQAAEYLADVRALPGRVGRGVSRLFTRALPAFFGGPWAARLTVGGKRWAWRQAGVDFQARRRPDPAGRLLDAAGFVGQWLALILGSPILLGRLIRGLSREYWGRPAFRADLGRFLAQPGVVKPGDLIFIPTLGRVEVRALHQILARRPLARALRWRLLFRTDLAAGQPAGPSGPARFWPILSRLKLYAPWRREFWRLRHDWPGLDLRLYTDTDELTDEFNRLAVFPFHTAAIPVDPGLIRPAPDPAPGAALKVLYIGDLRDEKGATHLPHLVRETRDLIDAGRIRYQIQSNFNVTAGEPASRRAMEILRDEARAGRVELIPGPLAPEEYNELLRGAGLVLIPYHAPSYQARSSGILAEAVAAGIPAVVTAGSTMARLAEPGRQAVFRRLLAEADVLEERQVPLGRFLDGSAESLLPPEDAEDVYLALELPSGPPEPMFMALHVTWPADADDFQFQGRVRQTVALCPGEPALALMPLRPVSGLSLAATLTFPLKAVGLSRLTEVSLRLVRLAEKRPPRAAGLAVFEDRADLLDSLRDLVEHYGHHRLAMAELAARTRDEYRPERLADQVLEDEPRPRLFSPPAGGRLRVLALTDVALGHGSPQVPSLVESLCRHYGAEGLILENDEPRRPPVRPDFLGPEVTVERLFNGGLPPRLSAAAYAAQARRYIELFQPDILAVSWLETLPHLGNWRRRPGMALLQALEMPGPDVASAGPGWDFHRIIFPEKHRARLGLARLGLPPDDPRLLVMPNSRLFAAPPTVRPAAGRWPRFVYAGGLGPHANTRWLLEPRCREFSVDIYGDGPDNRLFREHSPGYAGYVPADAAFFETLGRYAFSLILWPGDREDAYYAAPNKLYDALARGVPFISGPHPLAVMMVAEYGCGLITLDWTFEGFLAALRRARDIFPTPAYAEMVAGCARAHEANRWEKHFQTLAEGLPTAEELRNRRKSCN